MKDINTKYKIYESEGVKFYIIVDPESESAKIYKLIDYRYVKLADATNDKVDLILDECKIEFDFSLIWD